MYLTSDEFVYEYHNHITGVCSVVLSTPCRLSI